LKILAEGMVDEAQQRRQASQIARPMQQALRQILLESDGRCAISGESTAVALDVAHLLDVRHKGAVTTHNCFLLRADLHRLFDRNLIVIRSDGTLKLAKGLSNRYRTELGKHRVAKRVLSRIAEGLELRANLQAKSA